MSKLGASDDRLPRLAWRLMWSLGLSIPIMSLLVDLTDPNDLRVFGRDFANMWVGGKMALSGRSACVFDPFCYQQAMATTLGVRAPHYFIYPPHALFVGIPFALLGYYVALGLWTCGGLLTFVLCARSYLPGAIPPWLAPLTPAAGFAIWDGQFGLWWGAGWLACLASLEREHSRRAGTVAGLMTVKPHLGILLAPIMIVKRKWLAIIVAAITAGFLVGLSVLVFGAERWVSFFVITAKQQQAFLTPLPSDFYPRLMVSAFPHFRLVGAVCFALFATVCLWSIRSISIRQLAFPTATATILILPYAFSYDMPVACLGFAVVIAEHWRQLARWRIAIFALAFNTPQIAFVAPALVPFILAAALAEQCRLALAVNCCSARPKAGDEMKPVAE